MKETFFTTPFCIFNENSVYTKSIKYIITSSQQFQTNVLVIAYLTFIYPIFHKPSCLYGRILRLFGGSCPQFPLWAFLLCLHNVVFQLKQSRHVNVNEFLSLGEAKHYFRCSNYIYYVHTNSFHEILLRENGKTYRPDRNVYKPIKLSLFCTSISTESLIKVFKNSYREFPLMT